MTKITIATDDQGNVLGAVQADAKASGDVKASVSFGPGLKLTTVDVGNELDMAKAKDADAFHAALKRYAPKAG